MTTAPGTATVSLFPTNVHILLDFGSRLSKTDRNRREEAS
jgi:hypothetical protein